LGKRDALGELLKSLRADVLCLQEVSSTGLEWILDVLGNPSHAGVGREDGEKKGEHVPILLLNPNWELFETGTFWFSPTPDRPSRAWGAAHPRICTWVRMRLRHHPEKEFAIFNLHLDHKSRRAREESIRLLGTRIEGLPESCPVVVCGDFNLRDRSKAYSMLMENERGFVDGANTNDSKTPTWDGWSPFSFGRARIDYIFGDKNARSLNYDVLDNRIERRRLSDHHPVIADLIV
jgi:endonuclease/exonuclease/phosphatase family metal-dependent hydrolase